jgi:hypothetical protein
MIWIIIIALIAIAIYFWYITIPIIILIVIWYYKSQRQSQTNHEEKERQEFEEKSRNEYQKSKKTSQNDSKSDGSGKKYTDDSRNTIQQKRRSERLKKFKITESDAEIIFGKRWKSILGKPEHLFFYDVWKLDIKITCDLGRFKTRLGHLYSKVLEIIRIVDEENPEQARGKKSRKSYTHSKYGEYDYRNNSYNYGYDRSDYNGYGFDDEDDEDDNYEYDEGSFNNNYEEQEKLGWAYSVFGLNRNVTITEIRSRYRELSLKYHPDRNKSSDATLKMAEINNAYDLLSKFVGAA